MASATEKAIQKEIDKAAEWYYKTYHKIFEVHKRYDKVEKHFSWRIVSNIGGEDRVLAFGVSAKTADGPDFFKIKTRVFDFIKSSLTKAQAKWGTDWAALAKQQGLE